MVAHESKRAKRNPVHARAGEYEDAIRWEADAPMHCAHPRQNLPKNDKMITLRNQQVILSNHVAQHPLLQSTVYR